MRYSIAAFSLFSSALALPDMSLLNGGSSFGGVRSHDIRSTANGELSDSSNSSHSGSVSASSSSSDSSSSSYDSGSTYNGVSSLSSAASFSTSVSYASSTSTSTSYASSTSSSSSAGKTCESPDIVGCSTSSSSSTSEVAADSVGVYDFIIVGGGTAGLVIANRLSENSYTSVAIVEAGDLVFDNTNVTDVTGYGLAFGTEIDWQYESSPQSYAGGKAQVMRAGKALGGTSTINGLAYLRAQVAQIDAWELLGNPGWNWASLLPYFKRSEHFQIPTDDQVCAGAAYDTSVHGEDGPLKTGWNNRLLGEKVTSLVNATYTALGLPYTPDANGGSMRGFTRYPDTVDQALNVREDAGRAYYLPIENRTNLELYTNSFVQRITWGTSSSSSKPVANGVIFTDASGNQKTITAKKEVILSAGALRSPLLLELSGVGNSEILEKHGIEVKVDLPYVGENLQDQTTGSGAYNSNTTFSGTADYVGYFNVSDIFGSDTYNLNSTVRDSLSSYAAKVVNASNGVLNQTVTEKLFNIHYDLIFKNEIPISEILISPGEEQIAFSYWGLLPFSRGNIHIQSNDSTAAAAINPNYFMLDYDLQQQIGTAKAVRKLANTEALGAIVTGETSPGLQAVPLNASDDVWAQAVKASYRSNFHYISTAAMMAEELGGVVDSDLLVYGVDNVRVVDASVIPFQVCGHLTATIYALAEKAADAIKDRYY